MRKFPGIFPGNPRKFPGIFHRKIRWNSRIQVRGISCNQFRGISHNSFQGMSCNQFQGISCYQFCRKIGKCRQNLWKFLEISSEKFFRTNSWEFPENYSQDFLKSSSGISWNMLSIFLSKFTNHDLGPIVVNNLTAILPLLLFRSITIFLSQNVSRFWSYWSCHVFCLFR